MRKSYPSDITKKQFEIVRKDLEQATKSTHPRKYDLYDIFCAVLYLIKEGCSWRAIPHDFPKWAIICFGCGVRTPIVDMATAVKYGTGER